MNPIMNPIMKSVRNLAAIVLGMLTMRMLSFLLPMFFWLALGADGAFRPGSWETSGTWNAAWIVVAVVAAVAGGFVCDRVATGPIALLVTVCPSLRRCASPPHPNASPVRGRREQG